MENNHSRRAFLKTLALSAGTLALAPVIQLKNAFAAEHIKPEDPMAKAMSYVDDVAKADKKQLKSNGYVKGSQCKNCQFYGDTKTRKDPKALCPMVGQKEVNAIGWCKSWNKDNRPAS